jgi:1,3-beta-glucanosyltransferase GAS1
VYYADYTAQGSREVNVIDLLRDPRNCKRDTPHLQRLGVNTIFVEDLIPKADHSTCMRIFANAGIYVMFTLVGLTPETVVQEDDLLYRDDYTSLQFMQDIIDMAHEHLNTLGFNIRLSELSGKDAAVLKSKTRHIKQYMQSKGYRAIPVGIMFRELVNIQYPSLRCSKSNHFLSGLNLKPHL